MRYDDPNVPLSAVVGIVGAILLFVIVVVLQAMFYHMDDAERFRKIASAKYDDLERLDAEQLEVLNSYRWVNQNEGVVRIPIERAMEIVAAESAAR
jgi:hypothetical protein